MFISARNPDDHPDFKWIRPLFEIIVLADRCRWHLLRLRSHARGSYSVVFSKPLGGSAVLCSRGFLSILFPRSGANSATRRCDGIASGWEGRFYPETQRC